MALTLEEETERIANVLDGTNTAGPLGDAVTRLDTIETTLNAIQAANEGQDTQLTNAVTQLTAVVTQLTALVGQITTGNGHLSGAVTQLTGIHQGTDAGASELVNVRGAIDGITVDVAVSNADVQTSVVNRTPLAEQQTIQRETRARTSAARNPSKPGGFR